METIRKQLLVLCFICIIHASKCDNQEKALLQYLFDPSRVDAHNRLERPVADHSKPVEIELTYNLIQIIDVNEIKQVLKTSIWTQMNWKDYHFVWDLERFGNISFINIPPSQIWIPDILLYNSANENFENSADTQVTIHHNGNIDFMPPGILYSTCDMDITYFPFDQQTCSLKFGSWSFDITGIVLHLHSENDNQTEKYSLNSSVVLINNYVKHGEWRLISAVNKRNLFSYDCCPEQYYDVTIVIKIRRRSSYYTFNLILPCIIIAAISLLLFSLPPDAGEKISLGITILLAFTMFLMIVSDKLPKTSFTIPIISIYFSATMIMCTLSLIFTILVLNFHHRSVDSGDIPMFIRVILNKWIANCLFMTPPVLRRNFENKEEENIEPKKENSELLLILTELQCISKQLKEDEMKANIEKQWKFAARVVDRLCLIFFSICTVLCTVAMFLWSVPLD